MSATQRHAEVERRLTDASTDATMATPSTTRTPSTASNVLDSHRAADGQSVELQRLREEHEQQKHRLSQMKIQTAELTESASQERRNHANELQKANRELDDLKDRTNHLTEGLCIF